MPVLSEEAGSICLTDQARLAIEMACVRLAYGFCSHSDRGELDRYAALFAEDGRFHRPGLDITGRRAIREALQQRPATVAMRHVCANPIVDVIDQDHAAGSGSQLVYRHDRTSGITDPVILVDYADNYILTAEGWRIASRTVSYSF